MSGARPLRLQVRLERWPFLAPVSISGYTFDDVEVLVATLDDGVHCGRGEAYGVYYRGETPARLAEQIEAVRPRLECGVTREDLRGLMPCGGARNALDCALWELEARTTGRPVWEIAGLPPPRPVLTTRTVFAGTPAWMAEEALAFVGAPIVKLKLLGDGRDAERVRAVREARPEVRLCVDANQGFDRLTFIDLLPVLLDAGVEMVEQPFPIGAEALLGGLERPIPIAADESVQGLADMAALVGRFDIVNIKLDKCGGLTEGLLMAREARRLGLGVMVGCMTATSLSMGPAFILAQLGDLADVDAPLYLSRDRDPAVDYVDHRLSAPESVWGRSS